MISNLISIFSNIHGVFGIILIVATLFSRTAAWIIAGAVKEDGHDRRELLRSIALGGNFREFYIHLLIKGLDSLDHLMGDQDKANSSLPSPFSNRKKSPYWTPWSFDRCATIALLYPVLGIVLSWAWSGDA